MVSEANLACHCQGQVAQKQSLNKTLIKNTLKIFKNKLKNKMEQEYNWNLINKVAIPTALIEAYIFYTNISDSWKWISLIAGLLATGGIIYSKDKKKNNIFTGIGFVFLVALIIRFLKNSGII